MDSTTVHYTLTTGSSEEKNCVFRWKGRTYKGKTAYNLPWQ